MFSQVLFGSEWYAFGLSLDLGRAARWVHPTEDADLRVPLARCRRVARGAHLYLASNTLKGLAILQNGKSFGHFIDR
jgi:hypothetical protein